METLGCLPLLIALFAGIGALFTGRTVQSSPPELAVAATRIPEVDMRLAIDASAVDKLMDGDAGALIAGTVEALKSRFPGATVARIDTALEGVVELQVMGTSPLSDVQLSRLATVTEAFHLQIVARQQDVNEGVDLSLETERAARFAEANSGGLTAYNELAPEEGGPRPGLSFAWQISDQNERSPVALVVEERAQDRFDRGAIARFFVSRDRNGGAALGFDIREEDQARFEAFTGAHVDFQLAVVIGEQIVTQPNLNGPLRSGGIITGGRLGFADAEVEFLVRLLQAEPVPLPLKVLSIKRS